MKLNLIALAILFLTLFSQESAVVTTTTISRLSPAALDIGKIQIITDGISTTDCSVGGGNFTVFCRSNGTAWSALGTISGNGGGVPSGLIVQSCEGPCPAGWTEATNLNGRMVLGTLAANGNVGSTGGSDTITPEGTNSGGAVNAHSGAAVADHASHTHTYTDVLNHTHTINVTDPGHNHTQNAHAHASLVASNTAGTSGTSFTRGSGTQGSLSTTNATATNLGNTTGITAASVNPAGGVAQGTTNGPSATLTHAVTQPANHIFTQPIFTGTPAENRSAFTRCIFCKKD